MYKKINFILLVALLGAAVSAHAYISEIPTLDRKSIHALSDDQLMDAYIEAEVELEAQNAFHATSGFAPKEYDAYKNLIRYRMYLLLEMNRRKIEAPPAAPPVNSVPNPPVKLK